ncbi:MAG TPA: hypothetical protein ENJ79_00425 [Gammaproteobacteria bacterium]|nr:hypothetical protein [Gammaproteobacteria bacterium]
MHPEVLVQLRHSQFRTPRVLTYTEGRTEASASRHRLTTTLHCQPGEANTRATLVSHRQNLTE